jgi:hypothetical protein
MVVLAAMAARLADVTACPCSTCLPGSAASQKIIDGVMHFADEGLLIALIVGAVSWELGRHAGNHRVTQTGKRAVLISMVGAILVSGAAVTPSGRVGPTPALQVASRRSRVRASSPAPAPPEGLSEFGSRLAGTTSRDDPRRCRDAGRYSVPLLPE